MFSTEEMKMRVISKQSGFTLIEVMIVIAIMGLMIAAIAPDLFRNVEKAEKTRVASDIRQVESALKFYRLDNYRYPTQSQGRCSGVCAFWKWSGKVEWPLLRATSERSMAKALPVCKSWDSWQKCRGVYSRA